MDNKTDLRIKAKIIRKELDIKNISQKLCSKLRKEEYYINSKNVMLYYPLKKEVYLMD